MVLGIILSALITVALFVTLFGAIKARVEFSKNNSDFRLRTQSSKQPQGAASLAQKAAWLRGIAMSPIYIAALVATILSTALNLIDQWAFSIVAVCGISGIITSLWSVKTATETSRAHNSSDS